MEGSASIPAPPLIIWQHDSHIGAGNAHSFRNTCFTPFGVYTLYITEFVSCMTMLAD